MEHTLRCWMGDDGERQDDAASVPSHDVALSALLPKAPSGASASPQAVEAASNEPCMFFDHAIGLVHLQLAASEASSSGTLQLGIFELRSACST